MQKIIFKFREEEQIQGQIRKLIIGNQEIMDQNKIQNELQLFYSNLFKSNCTKSYVNYIKFLDKIITPALTSKKGNICEGDLVESELFKSLSSMQDCKSPGSDGLTKEFYKYFWNVIEDQLMNSIKEARKKKKLNISQRQAVIKLVEKKDRDKRYIKNWCPLSLLNVDCKILSKALPARLKETFPEVISCQQPVYSLEKEVDLYQIY